MPIPVQEYQAQSEVILMAAPFGLLLKLKTRMLGM
jgi:hypothetical protein